MFVVELLKKEGILGKTGGIERDSVGRGAMDCDILLHTFTRL